MFMYGLEIMTLTKRQEAKPDLAELKMIRFPFGVTRMERIRNEYSSGLVCVWICAQEGYENIIGK